MKKVTFAEAMSPHSAGDTRVVSDEVARDLQKQKLLSASEDWPARTDDAAVMPKRAMPTPKRPAGAADQRKAT